jgi:hypothetical protein
MKKLTLAALLLFSSFALAGGQDHRCQGGHNCNQNDGRTEVTQDQKQLQAQAQSQESNSYARSSSRANSYSEGGKAVSKGGDAKARGGDQQQKAYGGAGGSAKSLSEGSTSNSSSGSNIDIDTGDTEAANTAAALAVQLCQKGMSGQSSSYGLSVVGSDQLCDYWKAAEMARAAHIIADKHGDKEKAAYWDEMYYWNMNAAQDLLDDTEGTATADRVADQLFKPVTLIGLLFLLL